MDWRKWWPWNKQTLKAIPTPAATVVALKMHCDCCQREVHSFKTFADGERLCFDCAVHRRP